MRKEEFEKQAGQYTSVFEVNLDGIKRNVQRIRDFIGQGHELIGVVKGDAYGFGLERIAELLVKECRMQMLAVAHVCEGIRLREAGIQCGILVMSAVPERLLPMAFEHDLQIPVYNARIAEAIDYEGARQGKKLKVHIKVETGMNRMGTRPGVEMEKLLEVLKRTVWLDVYGTYTHFATARIYDNAFTKEQLERFKQGLEQIRGAGFSPSCIHAANSGAIMWLPDSWFTHVRSASLLIGYARLKEHEEDNPVQVEQIGSWRTAISNIYEVQPGESVGYGRHFMPDRPTRIALVPVGNCDGIIRDVALNQGPVLLNGQRTRYLGTCMDQCFIDVTDLQCEVGDVVTMFGRDGDTYLSPLELLPYSANMTCSQCFSTIGQRVLRRYVRDDG